MKEVRKLFQKYPRAVVKLLCSWFGGAIIVALIVGRLTDRIVVAPDFGIVILFCCVVFYLMAIVDGKQRSKQA